MNEGKKPANKPESSGRKSEAETKILGYTTKEVISLVAIPIIVSIVVSYFSFSFQYNNTIVNDRKNLANGYISDLENVNRTLGGIISDLDNPNNPDYHKYLTKITNYLYPPWGLYYSNRQDIQKFDSKTSSDLYDFYNKLLLAEQGRILYNDYESLHPYIPDRNGTIPLLQIQNTAEVKTNMANGIYSTIHDCHDNKLPKLITELKVIRDS
jgi:hypothetical protein